MLLVMKFKESYKTDAIFYIAVLACPLSQQGLGTHEDILVEVLATRSNQQIVEIKRVFKEGLTCIYSVTCR